MRFIIVTSLLMACGGQIGGTDGGTSNDATVQGDGAICVDLEPTSFDTSCNADPDCIGIYAGNVCSGYNCICPGSSISATSEAAYEAMLAKVPGSKPACSCPLFGTPHCIASECVFCPNPALKPSSFPPGCPDAGP